MHNSSGFGWVLLGLAVVLGAALYKLWREGASPLWAMAIAGLMDLALVALVIETWATN